MIKKSLLLAGLVGYVSAATDKAELWQMLQGNREAFAFKEEASLIYLDLQEYYRELINIIESILNQEIKIKYDIATTDKDAQKVAEERLEDLEKDFSQHNIETMNILARIRKQAAITDNKDGKKAMEKRLKLYNSFLKQHTEIMNIVARIREEIKRIDHKTDEKIMNIVKRIMFAIVMIDYKTDEKNAIYYKVQDLIRTIQKETNYTIDRMIWAKKHIKYICE